MQLFVFFSIFVYCVQNQTLGLISFENPKNVKKDLKKKFRMIKYATVSEISALESRKAKVFGRSRVGIFFSLEFLFLLVCNLFIFSMAFGVSSVFSLHPPWYWRTSFTNPHSSLPLSSNPTQFDALTKLYTLSTFFSSPSPFLCLSGPLSAGCLERRLDASLASPRTKFGR